MWPGCISTEASLSHIPGADSGKLSCEPPGLLSLGRVGPCCLLACVWALLTRLPESVGNSWGLFLSPLRLFPGMVVSRWDKKGFSGPLVLRDCDLVLWRFPLEGEISGRVLLDKRLFPGAPSWGLEMRLKGWRGPSFSQERKLFLTFCCFFLLVLPGCGCVHPVLSPQSGEGLGQSLIPLKSLGLMGRGVCGCRSKW